MLKQICYKHLWNWFIVAGHHIDLIPIRAVALFSGLSYITLYLLCMFPVMLFITSGAWIKGLIVLHFVRLAYDRIKLLAMKLI